MPRMSRRFLFLSAAALSITACRTAPPPAPTALRLVDLFSKEDLAPASSSDPAPRPVTRVEWRFDGTTPAPAADSAKAGQPPKHAMTGGWEAGPGVKGLAIRDGRLSGTSTDDFPLLHIERTSGLDDRDQIHSLEVRMKVSAGSTVSASFESGEKIDLAASVKDGREFPWLTASGITPDDQIRTYVLTRRRGFPTSQARHILLRPTNVADAVFEIESIRIVTRREHLAGIASGIGWQSLSEVYRETLVSRAGETITIPLTLPQQPWLDLSVGIVDNSPVTFKIRIDPEGGTARDLIDRTVTTPHRWEKAPVDLAAWAGRKVSLTLSMSSPEAGSLGFWGSPVVRNRSAAAKAAGDKPDPNVRGGPTSGVILIWADTLRRDHLDMYGYARETAPVLKRLAGEGTLFTDCVSQATWTKVSTPSLVTSLYPTSHTVKNFADRMPSTAHTLAEVYREAGHATLSMSSILFTGSFSNMHQGFEELHESTSLSDQRSSKTAREYVDRLLPWLEDHRDEPFFVFLHVSDPHDPYMPAPPYDTMWADPARRDEHEKQAEAVKKFIKEPLMRRFGMPSRDELARAGFDPDAYVNHDKDWYDGSIRAMDVEIGRLVERLKSLGMDGRTLLVFVADHGEEFLEHGRTFHGQTVYGELTNVPLMMWRPGAVPAGLKVDSTVRIIDVMPTLLEMSGLPAPEGMQGHSLIPLMAMKPSPGGLSAAGPDATGAAADRPGISEKARTPDDVGGAPPPHETESFSIVLDGWKLIHNTHRAEGRAEYELFDTRTDPLNLRDAASQHPDIVQRLSQRLTAWRAEAEAARLQSDTDAAGSLSGEELERLRSLGYIQ